VNKDDHYVGLSAWLLVARRGVPWLLMAN